ncbi:MULTISPECIES: DNA polymerase III subunit delta' [Acinetobacter]|uniref:DNA-directed DNA polymerase n=1 Tax=Acinetobacter pittii TaxID=48296 RepID=A0AAE9M547_ACIPI|nr:MULTISPECIES: DNA polymerase III subunit delta' [Acinetobacter calcoaceticus/baumannii complex]AZP29567.1 DNA polymerase III subunit delta' [Acinetobacter pittii]EXC30353.1 DNA polymerase III, delta subunit [Acinetobacter sp. 809848]EXE26107.1 DNA polymerase III, delta subunit [Acinetobacter sp. 907131]EXS17613.1 DNA polymerase III, delta subunit [Acinetobacter sp. 883425]MBK0409733.1 DNA polymerase III subunit delta' [Acinetobacter pittii]
MNPNVTSKVYPWQQTTWDTLTTRFPNIGHGLLFYGKQGCGKHAFAKQFLAWVLCLNKQPQGPCGECSSCQWLKSDTHPNYVHITTDEENKKQNAKIKIEKIRDLLPFVQQTGEGWRVIVIEPAEALNLASSNALLKTLEEPGERVVLILLADHYLKLPATIRSRLQHFALDRISYEQATSYLNEYLSELAEVQPDLLLGLSNDMPLQAIEIAQSDWFAKRQIFLNDWLKIVAQKNMPLFFSGKWQKELSFNDFIMLFEYLLGDLICVKLNQPQKNTDLDFDQLSPYYDLESLFNIYSELQQAKKLVEQNVQSQLIIDQLFITLMNI